MWPWGHLAVGYLLYSALARWRFDRPPGEAAALAVLFGTQFPDLIDKPLAWTVGLIPSGRSLAHSLLTASVVCALVWMYARHRGYPLFGVAFAVGYISHLFADALAPLAGGQYAYVAYLGWPVLAQPSYDTSAGFVGHLADITISPLLLFGVALIVLALSVWLRDGHPGLSVLRGWLVSWRQSGTGP